MRRWKRIVLIALGVLVVAGAVFAVPTLWFKPWSIDHFYARVFLQFALRRPMVLSSLRILEPMGLDFHSDDLDDMSVTFQVKEARWLDRQLEILRSYDRERMSEKQRLSRDVLEWFLADQQEGNRFMFHDYPVNQFGGIQSALPDFMMNIHQINNPKDAENYIRRVSKFGVALDQIIEGLKEREKRGVTPPRFVIQRVLKEMRDFTGVPAKENPLYAHFEKTVTGLSDLETSDRDELLGRLETEIQKTVYPAYGRLIDYCSYLEPLASTDDGVWRLPDGEAYYAHQLRSSTTTSMTAEEIHQLGLREVGRLQDQMRAILKTAGHGKDDPAAAMLRLGEEERFLYPDTDEGRERILADYQKIIDEIDAGLDRLFDVRPKVGVKVERVPEFKQATSPGAYYQPPPFDGSKPGIFFVNLRNVKEIPRFGMRTLAYHEAIPGHHFQIAVAQGLTDLPFFRRIIPFTAYAEGWALYTEQVAAENGFEENPYDRLGYLTGQLFRAVRLVVDTGIHSKRWTREKAIDYMMKNTGMVESDVVAEVERYIVIPGQACAYKVGQLKILELREKAKTRLGQDFDIRQFHNVVLTNGALPLNLLERVVDEWTASKGQMAKGAS
jgi:uncharacterized protein (DUF885 family)